MKWLSKNRKKALVSIVVIASSIALAGCNIMKPRLEAKDWISLAYAGLEATDHYEFTGSTSIEADGYSMMKPFTFQGKVTDHNQLTVQSSAEKSQYSHPSQILRQLKADNYEASIVEFGKDPETSASTVKIKLDELSENAKKRWEEQLKDQLKEIAVSLPDGSGSHTKEWEEELKRSEEQLAAMLGTLQVSSSTAVVIDTARMLPLKLNEYTQFQYERDGKLMKEVRRTVLHLHSFDGRASNAMQR
ncbi:hypothetical protein [Paenibacillus sp. GXUN7292]|uniref:hypothetical protein n=1 Tax=Paenibacillus sp. GXUN7292 TaxID=3422499 RepID=UPI003D7CBEE0